MAWPPPSCKAETIKQSIKTIGKTDIVSASVLSKVLILDYLSCPQIRLENLGDRLAQLENSDREREREIKTTTTTTNKQTKETNSLGRTT